MDETAEHYKNDKVGSIFVYTNEAHPGENYPHLTSMQQKFRHARDLRDTLGVTRPILVDSLDGACHRTYGGMPNMTWIFNRTGIPIYKSDWTDANSVANAIEYYLEIATQRKKEPLVPFHVERLDYRKNDRAAFYAGLKRNGPKAVTEFERFFGR